MPPNNCAVTATVTPYSEPTLSFPFSREHRLQRLRPHRRQAGADSFRSGI